jgi:5-methylthioribose kinase
MIEWLLGAFTGTWREFERVFRSEWDGAKAQGKLGDNYPSGYFTDDAGGALHKRAQEEYLRGVWEDTLGYAGLEMIR